MLRIAWLVGQYTLQSQEFLPEFQRIAIRSGLASTCLQIRLGLKHILLAIGNESQ